MKKKTFYILIAVWVMALATFLCVLGCSLNKDNGGGSSLPTPPPAQQTPSTGGGSNGGGNNGGSNNGGSSNGGSTSGDEDGNGNVYSDDGRDWIGG